MYKNNLKNHKKNIQKEKNHKNTKGKNVKANLVSVLVVGLLVQIMIPTGRTATNEDSIRYKFLKDELIRDSKKFNEGWQMKYNLPDKLRSSYTISHKKINKLQHIKNGNLKGQLKVVHWNLGSRLWKNKREEI